MKKWVSLKKFINFDFKINTLKNLFLLKKNVKNFLYFFYYFQNQMEEYF